MIWVSVISFLLIVSIMYYATRKDRVDWIGIGLVEGLLIFVFSVSLALVCFPEPNAPSPLDVYRGRTTLEITYRNGVPVDSVVVFNK